MGVWNKLKLVGEYRRIYQSEPYEGTMRAVKHLAVTSLLLLSRTPEEERQEIVAQSRRLTEKLTEAVATERPMVGALALLTAVRVHEELIREYSRISRSAES